MPEQTTGPIRWAVIAGTVSPYIRDLWSMVAQRGQKVLFIEEPRLHDESFEHEQGNLTLDPMEWYAPRNRRQLFAVAGRLLDYRPDITVTLGYARPRVVGLSLLSRLARPRSMRVLMGDMNGVQMQKDLQRVGPRLKLLIKRGIIRLLFQRSFDIGWSNGLANRMLGIPEGDLVPLLTVDFNKLVSPKTDTPALWSSLRRPILLCVARLVPVKNLDGLVDVWRGYCSRHAEGSLLVVGGGSQSRLLTQMTEGIPRDRLLFAGPIDRDNVGCAFRLADALVLPSRREPWGIVVTEALGCGLPVLASEAVGAAISLVRDFPGAIKIHRLTQEDLATDLADFLIELAPRRKAALAAAPLVREMYDMNRVAERLVGWGETAVRSQCSLTV